MAPITQIDTLLAALYPHIRQYRANDLIHPPSSLQPSECDVALHELVDSFAELFDFYPDCKAVAVAVQVCLRNRMSLYVCPSASTPPGFDTNVKRWFTQLTTTHSESITRTNNEPGNRLIRDIYGLCYAKMRQRAIVEEDFLKSLINPSAPKDEEEQQLRENVSSNLTQLSNLMKKFANTISRHSDQLGDETLRFHALCLEIRDIMKAQDFEDYINRYLYVLGVDSLLHDFFRLPIAISKLLSLPTSPDLYFDDEHPIIIVNPESQCARKFKAILNAQWLQESFGDVPANWSDVEKAFIEDDIGRLSQGVDWNAPDGVLSTGERVTPHPEVILIHHLLNNDDAYLDSGPDHSVYLACSTTPCYATLVYAGVVNKVLGPKGRHLRFTMRTDDPTWCRLSRADPWVLPDSTEIGVLENLRDTLLGELDDMMKAWEMEELNIGRY